MGEAAIQLLLKDSEYQLTEAVLDGGNKEPLQKSKWPDNHRTELISNVFGFGVFENENSF